MTGEKKWGSMSRCPACDKTVYPAEQVFAADRKPWHRRCIHCAVRGCRYNSVPHSLISFR